MMLYFLGFFKKKFNFRLNLNMWLVNWSHKTCAEVTMSENICHENGEKEGSFF